MNCPLCGCAMDALAKECPRCHGSLENVSSSAPVVNTIADPNAPGAAPVSPPQPVPAASGIAGDTPSFPMALLGFFIPLAGFIVYLVGKDKKPLHARSAGRGALLGFGISMFFVLILLPAILFPVFARARENARRASCQSHLQQLSLAVMQSAQANNDTIPDISSPASIGAALRGYTKSPDIHTCPTDHKPLQGNANLSGKKLAQISSPATTILFYETEAPHFDGRNVAYADGHVKWLREESWLQQKQQAGIR